MGQAASPGIAHVAETGDTSVLEAELATNSHVIITGKAAGAPIPATQTSVVEVEVSPQALYQGATLNLVAMIGKSNDSFISVRGLPLLSADFRTVRMAATNYDAGSEENTGNVEDFGPGGHPVAAAEGHISFDRGLNPRGNAPEILSWGTVAGWVTVERIR